MELDNQRPLEVAPAEQEQTAQELPPIAPATQQPLPQEDLSQTDITHRLADEFFLLREEFPALQNPENIPDAVLDMAVEKAIPLLDAYLRFQHEEAKRARREEERRREAAARSTGSLSQGAVDSHPEQDAFMRAFRTALK